MTVAPRRWLREDVWYPLRRWLRGLPRPSLPHRQRLTRAQADELFPPDARCVHCGCWHSIACPRVKRMRLRGGEPVEVEFRGHSWWWLWRRRLVTLEQKEALIGD